jgi:hypothetical protein
VSTPPSFPSANAVLDPVTGASLNYIQLLRGPDRVIWLQGCANEIGRLTQCFQDTSIKGTNAIHFIKPTNLPPGRMATYLLRIVIDVRPQKAEPNRVRFTAGGNLVAYPGDVSMSTADMLTAKLLFNSVLSTPKAKFSCFDISNFYLNTPMERYEYMRIPTWAIPDQVMTEYSKLHDEIRKGMYGLPQAGLLAAARLVAHLVQYGYMPCRHTSGLWSHATRPLRFSL